jgi:hypothetical protein
VTYTVTSPSNNSFAAALTIQNTGATSINGWTLAWTWSGNQQITTVWNASGNQNGQDVRLTSLSTNGTIASGTTLTGVSIVASYSGRNVAPPIFTVNGTQCQ